MLRVRITEHRLAGRDQLEESPPTVECQTGPGESGVNVAATPDATKADSKTTKFDESEVSIRVSGAVPDHTPGEIENFQIVREIGRGGMGRVYLAKQLRPVKRLVALKVIDSTTPTKQILARFDAERQALALMEHPGIAKFWDAGMTSDGSPYFALEYIDGAPLTEYCAEMQLGLRARLELLIQACRAIQHAHQKGVIHRDIKPSNMMVASDGRPVIKIIDFGLAKALHSSLLTDHTLFTEFGNVIGTLQYMSPEQAAFNVADVDTRSDVYSLGVVLYELLAGTPPLSKRRVRAAPLDEVIRWIRKEEAPSPTLTLLTRNEDPQAGLIHVRDELQSCGTSVRRELDLVVRKALEKRPPDRYESAAALAEDLERFLRKEPVFACPPTIGYVVGKAYARHKAAVLAAGSLLLALMLGLVGTTTMWLMANSERTRAEFAERQSRTNATKFKQAALLASKNEKLARVRLYAAQLRNTVAAWNDNQLGIARKLLEGTSPNVRGWEFYRLRRSLRGHQRVFTTLDGTTTDICLDPAAEIVYLADATGLIQARQLNDSELLWSIRVNRGPVYRLALADGILAASLLSDRVILLDPKSGATLQEVDCPQVTAIASHQSELFCADASGSISVYQVASGDQTSTIETGIDQLTDVRVGIQNGTRLLVACGRETAVTFDLDTRQRLAVMDAHIGWINQALISDWDRSVVTASDDGQVLRWNPHTGELLTSYAGHHGAVHCVDAVSVDGRLWLVSAGAEGVVRFFDWQNESTVGLEHVHDGPIRALVCSPVTKQLLTGGLDRSVRTLDVNEKLADSLPMMRHASERIESLAVSHDNHWMASVGADSKQVVLRDPSAASPFKLPSASASRVAFSNDSNLLITARIRTVACFNPEQPDQSVRPLGAHEDVVSAVATGAGEYAFGTASIDGVIRLWNSDLEPIREFIAPKSAFTTLVFASDGQFVFSADEAGNVYKWDCESEERRVAKRFDSKVTDLAISATCETLFATLSSGDLIALSTNTLEPRLRRRRAHVGGITCVVPQPLGDRLISAGNDGSIRVWDQRTLELIFELPVVDGGGSQLAFAEDGTLIAGGNGGGAYAYPIDQEADSGVGSALPSIDDGGEVSEEFLPGDTVLHETVRSNFRTEYLSFRSQIDAVARTLDSSTPTSDSLQQDLRRLFVSQVPHGLGDCTSCNVLAKRVHGDEARRLVALVNSVQDGSNSTAGFNDEHRRRLETSLFRLTKMALYNEEWIKAEYFSKLRTILSLRGTRGWAAVAAAMGASELAATVSRHYMLAEMSRSAGRSVTAGRLLDVLSIDSVSNDAAGKTSTAGGQSLVPADTFLQNSFAVVPSLMSVLHPPVSIEAIVLPMQPVGPWSSIASSAEAGGIGLETGRGLWRMTLHTSISGFNQHTSYTRSISDQPVGAGEKVHLAGVWNGLTMKLFVDGELQAKQPFAPKCSSGSGFPIYIGADPSYRTGAQAFFAGRIEEVLIAGCETRSVEFDPPDHLENVEGSFARFDFTQPIQISDPSKPVSIEDLTGNGHNAILSLDRQSR